MLNQNKNCDCGCKGETHCAHLKNPECACGEPLRNSEVEAGVCFYCRELEINRRLRLHNEGQA